MKRAEREHDGEVASLLVSIFFGFAINILTAETAGWRGPLQPVTRYPYVWVPVSIVAWVGWLSWQRRRRRVTWTSTENPYPGLAPFTVDRSSVFFGREVEIREVLTRLDRAGAMPAQRIVPLVGPSGSGKSSVVQAGVLPRLSKRWQVIGPLRPAANPFLALAQAIPGGSADVSRTARLLRDEAKRSSEAALTSSSRGGSHLLLSLLNVGQRPVLLVIDQLEDLYTLANEDDARYFLELLATAMAAQPTLHLLAVMRPEFLAIASGWQPRLFARPMPIGPLGPRHIRDAIERPAIAAGVKFEAGLVDVMVAEATVGDALPLLGHLLQRLYAEASDGVVTLEQYDRAGRVSGAIAEHANSVYQALLDVHPQEAVDSALLRCVGLEGDEPVRRPVLRNALDETGTRVLEEFRASRLVVDVHDGLAFELAHDALFRQWNTLADLVARNSERLRQLTLLEHRATAWEVNPVADDLLRGRALEQALQVVSDLMPSPSLVAFLAASRSAASEDLQRKADQAAAWAQQLRERDPELACAVARAAICELAASPAAVLTLWGLTVTSDTRRLPIGHTSDVTSLAWLPGSDQLRTVDGAGVVCTWHGTGELAHVNYVGGSAFGGNALLSPDGAYALVAEGHDAVGVWRITDDTYLGRRRAGYATTFATFSWDSSGRFAGQYDFDAVDVYSLETGKPKHIVSIPARHAQTTSWAPYGDLLAIASDESVDVYVVGATVDKTISVRAAWIRASIAWSSDGRHLAVLAREKSKNIAGSFLSGSHMLHIYDVTTGQLEIERKVAAGEALAWAPEGRLLAYAPQRDTHPYVELRDVQTWRVQRRRRRHYSDIRILAWSPDGRRLAFAGRMDGPEIWNLPANKIRRLPSGSLQGVSWSPDRTRAVVGTYRTPPRIVDEHPSKTIELCDGSATSKLRWSPAGNLVAGVEGALVHLWDPDSGIKVGDLGPVPGPRRRRRVPGEPALFVGSLEWSPDGTQLAVVTCDFLGLEASTTAIWDVAARRIMRTIGPLGGPLAWAPNGELLAGCVDGADGVDVDVWRVGADVLKRTWRTGHEGLRLLTWAPGSALLAAAFGEQVEVWDEDQGRVMARCVGHTGDVEALCWSADGCYIASADSNSLYLWQSEDGKPLAVLGLPRLANLRDLHWADCLTATFDSGHVMTWRPPVDGALPTDLPGGGDGRLLTGEERQRFGLPIASP